MGTDKVPEEMGGRRVRVEAAMPRWRYGAHDLLARYTRGGKIKITGRIRKTREEKEKWTRFSFYSK
jgi:hypothetical protein